MGRGKNLGPPVPGDEEGAALLARFSERFGAPRRTLTTSDTHKALRAKAEPSAEAVFAQAWESDPLPGYRMVRELAFHPERGWRFDFAWPDSLIALELEGFGGRHHTYTGFREDCVKYNEALLLGWRVLRVMSGEKKHAKDWLALVKRALLAQNVLKASASVPFPDIESEPPNERIFQPDPELPF